MDLSAATAVLNPADIFSLLPLRGNASTASTSFSVGSQKDFSAILTELAGPGDAVAPTPAKQPQKSLIGTAAATSTVVTSPTNSTVAFSPASTFASEDTTTMSSATQTHSPSPLSKPELEQAFADVRTFEYVVQEDHREQIVAPPAPTPSPAGAAPLAPDDQPLTAPAEPDSSKANITAAAPEAIAAPVATPPVQAQQLALDVKKAESPVPAQTMKKNVTVPLEELVATASVKVAISKDVTPTAPETVVTAPSPCEPAPHLPQVMTDVKNLECAVPIEAPKESAARQRVEREAESAPPEPLRAAPVTTDSITNVQQQLLPLRVIAVHRVVSESKPAEKNKQAATPSTDDPNATTPATQMSDLIRPVDRTERPVAAHPIEIPNLPHIPVVRTVSMEVGDSDAQVTIRIQERGGDIAMELNAGSDALQRDLQSSVSSLDHALKQEHVQVSTIEVFRKSPIDKVRRMKEAR